MARSHRQTHFRPAIDGLEPRQMPAIGVTAALFGGILAVNGTDGDDFIRVRVRPEGPWGLEVLEVEGVTRPILAARVRLVVVSGGEGDDAIIMDDLGRGTVPVWFDGGPGNDFLFGGGANDVLIGGEGHNVIFGNGESDYIDGGPGSNIINGVAMEPPTIPEPDPAPMVQVAAAEPTNADPEDEEAVELSPQARELFEETNRERERAELDPLKLSPALMRAAHLHAKQMALLNTLDHELPDAEWPTLEDRAERVGYDFVKIAENIAFNQKDGKAAVAGWLKSEGHRANLLNDDLTEIGVAVSKNTMGQPYYVQVLARPKVDPE